MHGDDVCPCKKSTHTVTPGQPMWMQYFSRKRREKTEMVLKDQNKVLWTHQSTHQRGYIQSQRLKMSLQTLYRTRCETAKATRVCFKQSLKLDRSLESGKATFVSLSKQLSLPRFPGESSTESGTPYIMIGRTFVQICRIVTCIDANK